MAFLGTFNNFNTCSIQKETETGAKNNEIDEIKEMRILSKRYLSGLRKCVGEEVAERVKAMEATHDTVMHAPVPHVIRLDGVAFRTLTAKLEKPFDARFTKAMLLTAQDLMERLRPQTVFVQSDEISLVFGGRPTLQQIMYGGRVQKMISVTASMAAAYFNHHFKQSLGWFDSRLLIPNSSSPAELQCAEAIWWRHRWDGRRNVVNAIGQSIFGHDRMQGVDLEETLFALRLEHNITLDSYPADAVYGSFLKFIDLPHTGFNPLTGLSVPTVRRRIQARSFDWSVMSDPHDRAEMVMSDTWLPHHPK